MAGAMFRSPHRSPHRYYTRAETATAVGARVPGPNVVTDTKLGTPLFARWLGVLACIVVASSSSFHIQFGFDVRTLATANAPLDGVRMARWK